MKNNNTRIEIEEQKHADALLFQALSLAGCDFNQEHEIDFLFLGKSKSLREIEKDLLDKGFVVQQKNQKKDGLSLTKKMKIDLAGMQKMTSELVVIANNCGAEYDGWGCVA